jgi:hypothetical protein
MLNQPSAVQKHLKLLLAVTTDQNETPMIDMS